MKKEVYGKVFRLLLIVGIVLVSYFYGFRLLTAEALATQKRIDESEQYYGKLLQKAANSEYYQEEIDRMEQEFDEVLASYRTNLSQEEDILFLHRLEQNTGIAVTGAEFTKENTVYQFDRDSMPSEYNPEESTGGLYGLSASFTFTFQGTYEQMKEMLAYTEEYENYMVVSGLEVSCNRENGMMNGTAVVRRYAVSGADRKPQETALPAVLTGTDNIFGDILYPAEVETLEGGTAEEEAE